MAHCIVSPYPIPPALAARKVPNIGDGFILRAVERLFGRVAPEQVLSPRVPLSPDMEAVLSRSDLIVLAGANQLNDNYTVWPGCSAQVIRNRDYRLLPVGIGLHGEAHFAKDMSPVTEAIIRAIHEYIPYSSWRCPLTVAYLEAALPDLKGRFVMTGCPVAFGEPLLRERRFHDGADRIAVTITEREDGWMERERATLFAVQKLYPAADRTLVLHQDFLKLASPAKPGSLDAMRRHIRSEATALGFRIFTPANADDAMRFYRKVDFHVGSRVHAHLFMLSLNRKSYVTAFDDRTRGLALAFGFPLLRPDRLEDALTFNFEPVREKALAGAEAMQRVIDAVLPNGVFPTE